MNTKKYTTLKGTVDSVVHISEETGFAVIMLNADGKPVTVVGEIGDVDEGEVLDLVGEYTTHRKYGEQFKAHLCERALPAKITDIRKYLAGGVIKGIGPVLAKKIVDMFGERVFEVFENDPMQLTKIDGISPRKAKKYAEEFADKFAVKRLMSYLSSNGIAVTYAIRAYKAWGTCALEMIESNPYCMCSFEVGLPFGKADEIGQRQNLAYDCEERVRAGIMTVLLKNSTEGHTCLPTDKLCQLSCNFLTVTEDKFDEILQMLHDDKVVIRYTKKSGRTYEMLLDFAKADVNVSRRLNIMSQLAYDSKEDFSDVIDIAQEQNGITYEEIQREAINTALSTGFLVLTGGPGTGKTTTLNAIISLFEQQGLNVMVTAPTGRAAKRLTELTGHDAKTIHRLLEVKYADGDVPHFTHNEENLLGCDVCVVDEMSMVDSLLFDALLRALPLTCKLILVGDSDQLPSVGAGNVLKDIIESEKVPVVQLHEVFRQAQCSRIVTNAHRIIKGEQIIRGDCDDFFFFSRSGRGVAELIVDLCKDRLPAEYGIIPTEHIQVLSPTRIGMSGTTELNHVLQEKLNPPSDDKAEIKTFMNTFRVGDKVMQNRNNYDIVWRRETEKGVEQGAEIYNGDIGTILDINRSTGLVTIDFDGRECLYTVSMMENIELAYAVTVHKSQGSEFDYVIYAADECNEKLLYRNLLYTAVTRARKMFIIVGSAAVINYMIQHNHKTNRYTCLKEMLAEDNGDEVDI